MVPIVGAIQVAGFTASAFTKAISALYSVRGGMDSFVDSHIESMKKNGNPTVSKVGSVLEGAKFGFGMGYLSSVTIMAAGQLLLGNTLAAVGEVAAAATLSNPIAMTCAAVGAIYFGWNALSEDERNSILQKMSIGLEIGMEMVKSILEFVIRLFKSIGDSKIYADLKKYVSETAKLFNRTLSDVTKKISDKLADAADAVVDASKSIANETGKAVDKIKEIASDTGSSVSEAAVKGYVGVKQKVIGRDKG